MNTKTKSQSKRVGATAVEFALTLPILFLVPFSLFEFGWMVIIRHTADNAAYEASRAAIVPGATAEDAIEEATRQMRLVGARSFDVEVTPNVIDESTEEVEVVVSGPFSENGIVATKFLVNAEFASSSKLLTERASESD